MRCPPPLLPVMTCLTRFLIILAMATAPAFGRVAAAEDPAGARVIVKYRALGSLMRSMGGGAAPASGPQHAAAMSRRSGMALSDGRVIDGRSQVVWGGTGITSAALAARLAADGEVEYAVPDERRPALAVPNDPLFATSSTVSPAAGQWTLRAPDATPVAAINAIGAWSVTSGSSGVVVAVIDAGVLFSHPDLDHKLYSGHDFIAMTSVGGDGSGRVV